MNVGELYHSPWGTYEVFRLSPLYLRGAGMIVDPSRALLERMTLVGNSGSSPSVNPPNEREGDRSLHAVEEGQVDRNVPDHGAPSQSAASFGATNLEHEPIVYRMTLGAYRTTMSMPPGEDLPVWVPCAGRSQVEGHGVWTHVYFLSSKVAGTFFCPTCRLRMPRVLYKRDGVVIHDTHHDVHDVPSRSLTLGSTDDDALCQAARGSGVQSCPPDLLAIAVARESTATSVPPTEQANHVDDAKDASLPPRDAPPPFSADDPKESVGSFARVPAPEAAGPYTPVRDGSIPSTPTPIGRPWRALWEWKEWCAERAGIIEFDGNVPRAIAERMARTLAGGAPPE